MLVGTIFLKPVFDVCVCVGSRFGCELGSLIQGKPEPPMHGLMLSSLAAGIGTTTIKTATTHGSTVQPCSEQTTMLMSTQLPALAV